MSEQKFGMETKHNGPCYVFEGHKLSEEVMKRAETLHPELVNGKKADRLKGLAKTYSEVSGALHGYAAGALKVMAVYDSPLEEIASHLFGQKEGNQVGVTICTTCLQNAMIACEEVLQTLKDIEDVCK